MPIFVSKTFFWCPNSWLVLPLEFAVLSMLVYSAACAASAANDGSASSICSVSSASSDVEVDFSRAQREPTHETFLIFRAELGSGVHTSKAPWGADCVRAALRAQYGPLRVPWAQYGPLRVPWAQYGQLRVPWVQYCPRRVPWEQHCPRLVP